jgi:nitrogen fixation protein FixH
MKRGMWWPIGVAGVLAATVAANIWVAVLANDDPSFAIEPDYYRKAVAWDTTLAQARHNALLGWRLTPVMSAIASDGSSLLSARLTDSTGSAISGAVIRVSALAVARASDVHDMTLTPSAGTGNYAVRFDARRAGEWELRFDATLGAEHFTQVSRVRLSSRASGSESRDLLSRYRSTNGHHIGRADPSTAPLRGSARDDRG